MLKRIWSYYRPYKGGLIFAMVLIVFIVAFNMLNPYITKLIFDGVFQQGLGQQIIPLLLAMIGFTLLKHVCVYTKGLMIERRSMWSLNQMREDLMKKFLQLSYHTYNKEKTGPLLTILNNDPENIKTVCASTIPAAFESLIGFVAASAILFVLSWQMALACYVIAPITFFASRTYSRRIFPIYREIRERNADLSTVAQENINGVRIVKSFANEEYETKKFDKRSKKVKESNVKLVYAWAKNFWKLQVAANYPTIILMSLGAFLVMRESISIGSFVAFSGYINHIMNPLNMLPMYIAQFQNAMVSSEKVFSFLEQELQIPSLESAEKEHFKGDIEFKDVSLSYDGNVALKHIDLSLPLGKKLGILGATSSGKTSLVNLIGRFYDCCEGEVLVDGKNIKEFDLRFLRDHLSYAIQDVFLFSDTIDSNIAFGNLELAEEDVREYAKIADADDFIRRMPEGYDTIVGERGIGLSGGQKQRISIARALAKDSRILILDDSTSALDMETEQVLIESLEETTADKTRIMIAHRISSVKDCDEIIFLDHGEIVERGTHDELLAMEGRYYQLFMAQYKDFFAEAKAFGEVM